MKICTKEEIIRNHTAFFDAVIKGAIIIYPTDTIYGIGCNALNNDAVHRIRKIKNRATPFSVIAPSKAWIRQHCEVQKAAEPWLEKLPGPYTLILPINNKSCVAPAVMGGSNNTPLTLGIRMLNHWMQKVIAELGIPLVTTSANKAGKEPMISLDTLDPSIKSSVDLIIDDGIKKGKPSTIVHLDKEHPQIVER